MNTNTDTDETVFLIYRSTTYTYAYPETTRTAIGSATYSTYAEAESGLMHLGDMFGPIDREGQFTTFTIQEFAPIPF